MMRTQACEAPSLTPIMWHSGKWYGHENIWGGTTMELGKKTSANLSQQRIPRHTQWTQITSWLISQMCRWQTWSSLCKTDIGWVCRGGDVLTWASWDTMWRRGGTMCRLVDGLRSDPVGSNRQPCLQVESENGENDQNEDPWKKGGDKIHSVWLRVTWSSKQKGGGGESTVCDDDRNGIN